MSDPRPKELITAENLMYNVEMEEALEIVTNFGKRCDLTPRNQITVLLLRGEIYAM